jgi:hypothetical protein
MFRSLLNTAKGKSALHSAGTEEHTPPSAPAIPRAAAPAPLPPSSGIVSIRPDRCCVYCGHVLYAPPRLVRVRCPRCCQEMASRDVVLSGEVSEERVVTAAKIVVAPGARCRGELVACNIEIEGMVLGNVLASHCCRLKPTAKVAGNILCRHLVIEPGAVLEGQVELVREKLP